MNATHLRNIFMPPEGVEMTGNDPHHPEMHIDRRAFRDDRSKIQGHVKSLRSKDLSYINAAIAKERG